MKKKLPILMVVSVLTLGVGACTHEETVLNNPPGTYEKTTSTTDAYGTTVKRTTSTDVDVDEYGNKRAVVKSKTTKDPKGLFNKSTSKSTEVIEER